MRVVYFDCLSGAAGDMVLGALADAGAQAAILSAVEALSLPGCWLGFERVNKGGLSAMQALVETPPRQTPRRLRDLLALLEAAALVDDLRMCAAGLLRRLAQSEAEIHAVPVEEVHLHELGGDDTLIDIVGALAGMRALRAERVIVAPLPLACGWTVADHGRLPLPAPATLKLLAGAPVYWPEWAEAAGAELVTPTGAAVLTAIADGYGRCPPLALGNVGYGAGRRDLPVPNVLRVLTGEMGDDLPSGLLCETLTVLETNIDDLQPQIYAHVMRRLFAAGALDVTLTPLQMKKERSAVQLTVLCRPEQAKALLAVLFDETTTLGVRRQTVERVSLPRWTEMAETPYGPVRIKATRWRGRVRRMPEYEDCRRLAEEHGVPLLEVMDAVRLTGATDGARSDQPGDEHCPAL